MHIVICITYFVSLDIFILYKVACKTYQYISESDEVEKRGKYKSIQ